MENFKGDDWVNMDNLRAQSLLDALVAMGMGREAESALQRLLINRQIQMAKEAVA